MRLQWMHLVERPKPKDEFRCEGYKRTCMEELGFYWLWVKFDTNY